MERGLSAEPQAGSDGAGTVVDRQKPGFHPTIFIPQHYAPYPVRSRQGSHTGTAQIAFAGKAFETAPVEHGD